MLSRFVSGGALAAILAAAMLLLAARPSAAFALSSPSLENRVATAGIEPIWYYHHYHHRHCWIDRYGHRHCRYW